MSAERRAHARATREGLYAPDSTGYLHLTRGSRLSTVDRALELERVENVGVRARGSTPSRRMRTKTF
jgi:hypothetical protein